MQISAQHLAEIVEAARKMEQGAASDKRRYIRHSVVSRVDILSHAIGATYVALTRDLSVEGLGLLNSVPLARGEQFSVALPRAKTGPLLAQCTVLHMREVAEGIWGIGAAFVSTGALDANLQADAIARAEAQRIAAKILG